ncbi:iron-containing alcohol dehydrogenase [Sinanaerobacter chloroacetimidivorans]|uniref:Iron-containing alcohol dehydrogenase n=1 Tax=Sinanaerobacter chloroacetimidivorans TaxID=2818044 RepID=A0A8J7VZM1_9FIRM|nr:iron-containing alcohol dehydrogenase [Sinanaerobacter chloroacetimidivorans]MBR0598077.1 iron-containing alcohol dehydrogenase [Sinanaerobacter chloroacetimidivorans]
MKDFQYRMPTKIRFGVGISKNIADVCKEYGAKKVFVVTDSMIIKTNILDSVKESFEKANMPYEIYSDIVPDPAIEVVDSTAEILRKSGANLVVAVGGGSPIDAAKSICMLQTNEGSVRDYLFGGSRTVTNPGMPLICVPTTAGSGSEMTAAAVITDNQNQIKLSVTHDYIIPRVALIDPLLHVGMPGFITATTGIDALTHAIEAYVSLNASPVSDAMALQAMRMIGKHLRNAVANGNDIEARSNMAIASSIAATAFFNGGLGVVHGIAQSMGGVAHVPHGVANSLILPYAMARNVVGNLEKFKEIAIALGENVDGLSLREAAEKAPKAVLKLAQDTRVPLKLKDVGVTREHFPAIIEGTMAYRLLAVNPCKLQEKDITEILESAYE